MKFKGTIIITDPCYIMRSLKDKAESMGITIPKHPEWGEPDYSKKFSEYWRIVDSLDDWRISNFGENLYPLGIKNYFVKDTLYGDWSCTTFSTSKEELESNISDLRTYLDNKWEAFNKYGEDSNEYKIADIRVTDITSRLKVLGKFCADTGLVGVFLLDEVLKYNPKFSEFIENKSWCVTVIKDFDGEVEYRIDNDNAHIVGRGNINFFTERV